MFRHHKPRRCDCRPRALDEDKQAVGTPFQHGGLATHLFSRSRALLGGSSVTLRNVIEFTDRARDLT